MTDGMDHPVGRQVPWRGRPRVADPKDTFITVRCTGEDRALIEEQATIAGLSVSAYLRSLALGAPGPRAVRRPPVERAELAKILAHLGKLGSNVNQIAKAIHTTRNLPSWSELAAIKDEILRIRGALFQALGRDY